METTTNALSILIIEDNPGDQILLEENLKRTNLSIAGITHAGTMAEAFNLLKQHPYSLIFLDLFLPDSVGMESFLQLIKQYCTIPVVISSGLNDTQVALKAISFGAQDFLLKGDYTNTLLEKVVRYSIERKKNLEEIAQNNELLKASEESYRYLFDNNPAAILIWDLNNLEILEANESAIKLYGYSKEEFLQMAIQDIWPEKKSWSTGMISKKTLAENFKVTGIFEHTNKNNEVMSLDISSHKIVYKGKEVVLSLASNVTEKLQLEKKLAQEKAEKQYEITDAVITAQEKERYFLGEELHDNINQILATSKLYIECGTRNKTVKKDLILDSRTLIIKAMNEIRNLSQSLLPPSLGQVGLTDALNDMIENIKRVNDLKFITQWEQVQEHLLSEKLKLTVFRIVQEQLNNIFKHSQAKTVTISLLQNATQLELHIKDDGVGFKQENKRKGVGLQNIESRASLFYGKVTINSKPGKGCELSAVFNI